MLLVRLARHHLVTTIGTPAVLKFAGGGRFSPSLAIHRDYIDCDRDKLIGLDILDALVVRVVPTGSTCPDSVRSQCTALPAWRMMLFAKW